MERDTINFKQMAEKLYVEKIETVKTYVEGGIDKQKAVDMVLDASCLGDGYKSRLRHEFGLGVKVTHKFEVGKIYKESVTGKDRTYPVECIARTAKFVTFETLSGQIKKKISTAPGFEGVYTAGSVIYSKDIINN